MLLYVVRRELCRQRHISLKEIRNSFTRHTKSSRWSLKQSGNSCEVSNSLSSNLSPKCLLKPFLFTVSFNGCCFVGASVWQYEEMRKFAYRLPFPDFGYKRSEFRREMYSWWHSHGEGQKMALAIFGLNFGVFLLWRVPVLYPFMTQYFSASPALRGSCLPMFLSAFSHRNFLHLAANMYVLYTFASAAVDHYGKEQFFALYCSAGVISSFTSYVFKVTSGRLISSLGASGAIMAVVSSVCIQSPNCLLQIVLLPFFTFPAGIAIKAIMALDLVGLVAKWKLFDHAAHLGGACFGIAYLIYGQEYVWQYREYIFKWYHNIREKKS